LADYDILFALGYDDPGSVLGSYIRHVANGGLTAYKAIFQGGKKAGEPVYVHFLNGVLTAERLRPLLGLSDTEARVLYAAFSVHDINKLVEGPGRSFNVLAVGDVIRAELERIGVPAFFPQYRDYLEDIVWLVRYHSGHYSTAAEGLIAAIDHYGLERKRLQSVLGPLMRALDVLDLSTTLDERTHKAQFLLKLNEVSEARYTFVTHQVSEQRGLLTNLIHNQVSAYLQRRWGLVPLLFYPDGVAYLAEEGKLSSKQLKQLFDICFEKGEDFGVVYEREKPEQISDTSAIEKFVDEAIAANPKQVEQYRAGKKTVAAFFVGQVMRLSKGQANPGLVNELVVKKLDA